MSAALSDAVSDDRTAAVLTALVDFARTELFPDGPAGDLRPDTELVASGLLKSLETARILAFVEHGLGVRIPLSELRRTNFETLQRLATLVISLGGRP